MITKKQLIDLAKISGNSPSQQEKHYTQSIILFALGEEKIVFKGGTYLWFFHGLKRFSEDLDFTALDKVDFIDKKIIKTLDLFGFESKISKKERKNDSLSFRVDVKGPLYKNELSKNFVYVEISLREKLMLDPKNIILKNNSYLLPERSILCMPLEEVAAEKVRAILTRNKPRDVYDLNFLISEKNISFNKSLVEEKLKYYKTNFSHKDFKNKLIEKEKDYFSEMNYLLNNKIPSFEVLQNTILNWIN